MVKKVFSASVKEKAVQMLQSGQYTQQQVADKIGCSISALQAWKTLVKAKSDEGECSDVSECPCAAPSKRGTADELIRRFWHKNYRAVDMLLAPKDVSPEEAVKLVNEALTFAYEHFDK